jgi:hypothetical protein
MHIDFEDDWELIELDECEVVSVAEPRRRLRWDEQPTMQLSSFGLTTLLEGCDADVAEEGS